MGESMFTKHNIGVFNRLDVLNTVMAWLSVTKFELQFGPPPEICAAMFEMSDCNVRIPKVASL
jgi:hypothetical protein